VAASFGILLILFGPVYLSLRIGGFMTERFELVYRAAVDIFFTTTLYFVLARRLAAPGQPSWRILDLDDKAAARLPILAGLASFVSVATRSFGTVSDGLYLPVTYTIGQLALSALAMLLLLAAILLTVRGQAGLPGRTPGRRVYFHLGATACAAALAVESPLGLAPCSGLCGAGNYISSRYSKPASC